MNGNGTSPRIGLLLAYRFVKKEVKSQESIRDRAKRKSDLETQEEAEYAVSILERVGERISTEAKKHGRASDN